MAGEGVLARHARAFYGGARSALSYVPVNELHVVRVDVPDSKCERFSRVEH